MGNRTDHRIRLTILAGLLAALLLVGSTTQAAVKVTAASSNKVTLEAGKKVTLSIKGIDLKRIRSAGLFLRNRMPVRDVAVTYRASSDTAATITLLARRPGIRGPFALVLNDGRRPIARVPVTIAISNRAAARRPAITSASPVSSNTRSTFKTPGEPAARNPLSASPPRVADATATAKGPGSRTRIQSAGAPLQLHWVNINGGLTEVTGPEVIVTFGYSGAPTQVCLNVALNMNPGSATCYGEVPEAAAQGIRYDLLGEAARQNVQPGGNDRYTLSVRIKDANGVMDAVLKPIIVHAPAETTDQADRRPELAPEERSSIGLTGRPPPRTYTKEIGLIAPAGHGQSCWAETESDASRRGPRAGGISKLTIAADDRISQMWIVCTNGITQSLAEAVNPAAAMRGVANRKSAVCPNGYELSGITGRLLNVSEAPGSGGVVIAAGMNAGALGTIKSITCTQRKTEGSLKVTVPLQHSGEGIASSARCNGSDVVLSILVYSNWITSAIDGVSLFCGPQVKRYWE